MLLLGILALLSAISAGLWCYGTDAFCGTSWAWIMPVSFFGTFIVLAALGFLALVLLCRKVDLSKPQEHDSKFFRVIAELLLGLARVVLLMRIHTRGLEQMPKKGRFFLVSNHINDMDPITLLMFFNRRQLAFISKRENASLFIVGKLMHKLMCQMINRENDREALKTILECIRLIKEDEVSVAVFPEGYTSMDGKLHGFRHGVFKIALKTKVPIVVCTLQNTNQVFANAAKLKVTDVHVHLLKVIYPEEYEGMTTVELGEMVHKMMADDLGPDLVLQTQEEEV